MKILFSSTAFVVRATVPRTRWKNEERKIDRIGEERIVSGVSNVGSSRSVGKVKRVPRSSINEGR